MTRYRIVALSLLIPALIFGALSMATPARANVTALVLHTRTCGTVSAFIAYDSFSEGILPFWAVFVVDLNGNGKFGEAGEPMRYVKLTQIGQVQQVGAQLRFAPLSEGSEIAVTAYELDSAGTQVSRQIEPVKYVCKHRPAKDPLPPNTGIAVPGVGIVAKVNITAITVYSGPTVKSEPLGGLGLGAFVNVVARNQRGDWVQIEYKGGLGWIMWQTQVLLFGPFTSLPRLPNQDQPTPTAVPPTPIP
jgi:hypothetical protein